MIDEAISELSDIVSTSHAIAALRSGYTTNDSAFVSIIAEH